MPITPQSGLNLHAETHKGPSEQWIRQKAGFGRHDDAARAREQSFREYLTDLADGPVSKDQTLTITLARTEYLEIAAAKPGTELIRAMPSAVMNLLLLLGEEGGIPLPGGRSAAAWSWSMVVMPSSCRRFHAASGKRRPLIGPSQRSQY